MKKLLLSFVCGLLSLASSTALAAWNVSNLSALTQAFTSGISSQYGVTAYQWNFLDPANCFTPGVVCFFSNPDGPYGYPFVGSNLGLGTRMTSSDALVMIMETPPPMTYFGITPYLYTRYYSSLPGRPGQSGTVQVFESLTDSINMDTIKTAGSGVAGQNVFTQLSVVVMTADRTTYNQIVKQLVALGFPSSAINLLAMPLNAVPLHMGTGLLADTYTMLIRLAYPNDTAQMKDYINRIPIAFLQLTPTGRHSSVVLPTPVSRVPGDGVNESSSLQTARDQLVQQLLASYGNSYSITETTQLLTQTNNYHCIQVGILCNVDNSDALYTHEVTGLVPSSLQDKILVVGVNHVDTGKATYVSHSVTNDLYHVGVMGINNVQLQGTALIMGGVSGPSDPRYSTYSDLYAFTVSYDCSNEPVCFTIPQPTATSPVGIPFGTPIDTTTRYYVDPATDTRPSSNEVIFHRVFVLKKL